MIGHCPKCGGKTFLWCDDIYACEVCGERCDVSEVLEDGPEAEALRERNEEAIGDRQYAVWLERKEREIAILKACRPEMCAVDDSDVDRLAEVLRGE